MVSSGSTVLREFLEVRSVNGLCVSSKRGELPPPDESTVDEIGCMAHQARGMKMVVDRKMDRQTWRSGLEKVEKYHSALSAAR